MAKLFKLPSHKRFDFQPRYYNEQAESRKKRQERILREIESEKAGQQTGTVREEMEHYIQFARKHRKKSNIRVMIILFILLVIVYLFLYR